MGAAMVGSGAAAGCVRLLMELLRWVSPGLGSRGPGGAERLRRGKLAGAQSARPACAQLLLAAGKGARASGRQRGTSRGARTVLNSGVRLPEHYFEQGSVTRGSSSCRKLEFLG